MPTDHRTELAKIKRFDQLIAYLRDEMAWPIARDSFEDVDDLFYDFTADELGIDPKTAAKITEIKRLKPLSTRQPWGIFFVKFEPKKLPVVALRRILSQVALKKRASANSAERTAWAADDLLFVSNYGEGDERQISFAHFAKAQDGRDLPTLKVLGWDNRDTAMHLDDVAKELTQQLSWPDNDADVESWRERWRGAFTLRHGEVVSTSKELSIRLAKLAGGIRDRIKSALDIETDRGPLTKLMRAFQTSLVHDLDAHGFADMYAQTIAYGLLSARIADPHKKTADDFAAHMRTNPFLRELMETFLKVGGRRGKAGGPGIDFDELGVSDVVQLLDDANMEAVVRDFGDKNPQEDPVIHFYELFLKEYDAKKRMQRGVFYTPRPVVSYIVRSVDELLRTEFGLEDGLASTTTWGEMAKHDKDLKIPDGTSPGQAFVQILDPATGTGTFLVEVIEIIHKTMTAKWKAMGHSDKKIALLWNQYVPEHLLPRLHAYELLMAPYAIAHLKVGLKLYETGYRFGSDERARIYLTNALEPASDGKKQMEFAEWLPALAHEARAVNEVKRKQRFTIVIGNPPYSGVSSNRNSWIEGLLRGESTVSGGGANYYEVDGANIGEKKIWLQDDYVKFIRFAHYLLDQSSLGVHGMITNHSFLDSPTCRGMRYQMQRFFTSINIIDLHGSTKKGEAPPDGIAADDNLFDILPGVAILVAVTVNQSSNRMGCVRSYDLWGARRSKSDWLLTHSSANTEWRKPNPRSPYYLFVERQLDSQDEYQRGLSLKEIFPLYGTGIQTSRDDFATDPERAVLEERLRRFFDLTVSDKLIASEFALTDTRSWRIKDVRRSAKFETVRKTIVPFLFRTFDRRWIALTKDVVDWPRLDVMSCVGPDRIGLLCSRQQSTSGFQHALVVNAPVDMFCLSNKSREGQTLFPLFTQDSDGLFGSSGRSSRSLNFGAEVRRAIASLLSTDGPRPRTLGLTEGDATTAFYYIYAILYCPTYRSRYRDLLKMDYPRVPFAQHAELYGGLANLGRELVALHLLVSPNLEHLITAYTGPKSPQVGRVGWSNDTVWLDAIATKKGQPATSGTIGFRGVPESVWNFHIGGYQVCEKWLKDRKGRTLSKDDIVHYQKIIVALSETIRLMKEIDQVIDQHGGWPGAFQTSVPAPHAADKTVVEIAKSRPSLEDVADPQPGLFEQIQPVLRKVAENTPSSSTSSSRTKAGEAATTQLDSAELVPLIRQLFNDGNERERDEAIRELGKEARLARVSPTQREALDDAIRTAVRRGVLENRDGSLRLAARSMDAYDRAFLKDQFLASLGGYAWTDREEAVRAFARWMGFRRTGAAIDETTRSLMNGLIREGRLESDRDLIRRARG